MSCSRAWVGLLSALLVVPFDVNGAERVFYDGFESGTTELWQQDGTRSRCVAVQDPGDGGVGPRSGRWQCRCNFNGTLAWNDPERYESLGLAPTFGGEYLLRVYVRTSDNLASTGAAGDDTGPKLLRYFGASGGTYGGYLGQESVNPSTEPVQLVWTHEAPGPSISQYGLGQISRTGWTQIEIYFSRATNLHRIWIDDVLVRDTRIQDLSGFDGAFYLTSNWSGADGTRIHDAVNYVFFDEVEVFTETGTGANGSLPDGTVAAGGGLTGRLARPLNLRLMPP